MVSETRTATVSELEREGVLLVQDGNHGAYRPRPNEFVDQGVAFIRASDIYGGQVLFSSASRINEMARQRITKGIGAVGDVLLSHKGTVGKVAFVPENAPEFVCSPQTTFWRVLDQNVLDRRYLNAFLRSPGLQNQLRSRSNETDMAPYVSLTSQRAIVVTVPAIETQRNIGHILGTLENKIDLNRCMIETLQDLARSLYNSWFVDFDPVKAKADGRQSFGMDAQTATLFPDSFEESEANLIPKGWAVEAISHTCSLVTRGVTPKYAIGSGRIVINQKVNRGSRLDWSHAKELAPELVVPPDKFARQYDILINCLGEGTLGRVHFYYGPSNSIAVDQHMSICRFESPSRALYSFLYLSSQAGQSSIEALKTGSTGMTMFNISKLRGMTLIQPPSDLISRFGSETLPLYELIQKATIESQILASIRDTLLPKLISGELCVPDAVKLLDESPL